MMRTESGKNFIIDVRIYPVEIMVSIGQSSKELKKSINKWPGMGDRNKHMLIDGISSEETGYGILHKLRDRGIAIIQIFHPVKKPYDHGVLAHEIFHAVEYIAEYVELKHCEKSSEAFAYLVSYLTTKIYKRMK